MAEEGGFWDTVGFVRRSDYRSRVLRVLSAPYTPSELARELGMHQPNVSRALGELKEEGLVEVLTPDAKHGRLYARTGRGDEVAGHLPDA